MGQQIPLPVRLENGEDIPVSQLDLLLSDVQHINLMKIDVEGHELQVLRGSTETLETYRPALFLEFLDKGSYNRTVEFIKPYGYKQVGVPFQEGRVVEFVVP